MQPRQRRANEPFTGNILRLIGSIREPEARFDVATDPSLLRSLCAQERVEMFVSYKAFKVEKTGVSPIRCDEEIGGAGAGLQSCWQQRSVGASQVCSPYRNFKTASDGRLRRASLRIPPIETVFHQSHDISNAHPSDCRCARHLEVIRDDWNKDGQIEIRMKAPCEGENTFVLKRGPCSRRDAS